MNKKSRILFVTRPLCPPWDEASKNFAYQLAKNVTKHDITILTCTFLDNMPENITQEKIYTKQTFDSIQKAHLFWFLLRHSGKYDIVHFFFTPTTFNSFFLDKILQKKCKIVQTVATLRRDLYNDHQIKKILFGDVIVSYSNYAKENIKKVGVQAKIERIYPGIDLKHFFPTTKDASLMKKHDIHKSDFVVLWPGEYTRLGATDMIVSALKDLYKDGNNRDIKFIFACRIKNQKDEKKKTVVKQNLLQAGCAGNIIFIDSAFEMNKIYNLSDVVVFPVSNMQGKFDVPLTVIESYACEKSVILTDLQIFSEFSNENISAIIPKDNPRAFAEKILLLKNDPEKRKEIGKNARSFVEKSFTIHSSAESYERLYDEI